MGRWAHLDTDEERLPEGMTRVGYDADTQIYTYRDTDGSYWEGAPGVQYGKLFRVQSHQDAAPQLPSITIPDDVQGDEQPQILPDYDGDGIPDTPSLTTSRTTSPPPRVTTPQRVRLRRSHYTQRKSKRLPSLPGHGGEKSPALSRVTSATSGSIEDHDGKENTVPEAPELTPSHSHSTSDADSVQKEKDFANANPIFTPHIHRQRRAQEREKKHEQTGLKRAGTISRIARFLSRSAGGNKKDNHKDSDSHSTVGMGLRSGMSTRTAFSSTATGFGGGKWNRWPGLGGRIEETDEEVRNEKEEVEGIPRRSTSAQGHRRTNSGMSAGFVPPMPKPRGRAMTFDEILASDGRLRGVVSV
ncbi:hypothetical protein V8F33_003541 [Rhypophila sp. PSN 637]